MGDPKQPGDARTTSCNSESKVTKLTKWKRLANVPDSINITGLVQAVHWSDYIVFLDNKNVIYLYHPKCG